MTNLARRALEILQTPEPSGKVALSRSLAADWRAGTVQPPGAVEMPDRPARPARPVLTPPRGVKRRKITANPAGRIALLHAIAHIELNAIDLAWDMVARFGATVARREFADDWVTVAAEEAEHFALLQTRLTELGAAYGDLPAHDGLWQAAQRTAHDLLARLAAVPMVLEARGLDVTPAMIGKLEAVGDDASVRVLRRIYTDEIKHVAAGARWFAQVCAERELDQTTTWRELVNLYCNGVLKPPFNAVARERAGMHPALYAMNEAQS